MLLGVFPLRIKVAGTPSFVAKIFACILEAALWYSRWLRTSLLLLQHRRQLQLELNLCRIERDRLPDLVNGGVVFARGCQGLAINQVIVGRAGRQIHSVFELWERMSKVFLRQKNSSRSQVRRSKVVVDFLRPAVFLQRIRRPALALAQSSEFHVDASIRGIQFECNLKFLFRAGKIPRSMKRQGQAVVANAGIREQLLQFPKFKNGFGVGTIVFQRRTQILPDIKSVSD